jgi:hypothetical protein
LIYTSLRALIYTSLRAQRSNPGIKEDGLLRRLRLLAMTQTKISSKLKAWLTGRSPMRLNIKAFSLTCAIFWSLSLFIMTWWLIAFKATGEMKLLGEFYRGFTLTPLGSVIGTVWAFFDALIGGAIFAWVYNKLAAKLLD